MVTKNTTIGGWFPADTDPEGFGGMPGHLPWLGLPLRERQERAFLQAKISFSSDEAIGSTPDTAARVLVREDVVLTNFAVEALIARGELEQKDIQWRGAGRFGAFCAQIAMGDPGPFLVWLTPGGQITPERIRSAEAIEFDAAERLIHVPAPNPQLGADLIELPLSDRLVLPVGHWLQLLWANLMGLPTFLWRELAGRNPVEVVFKGIWTALLTGSTDPMKIGARMGRKGKGCRIHPSAVVEGSWLGDGVEVGANAVVRGSVLADGVHVEDLSLVEFSVLAERARVQRLGMVKFSVLGTEAAGGGAIQLSVLAPGASVKHAAALMDVSLGQQGVQVMRQGTLCNAPLGFGGVCVGPGTTIGAGVMVGPGRMVPGGLNVARSPDQIVRSIPTGITGTVSVKNGKLEPI